MGDKKTVNESEPVEYGIDVDEMMQQVKQNLRGHKEYRKLEEEYERLQRNDYVKINLVQTKMRQIESRELDRLWTLELERRKNSAVIGRLLKKKDRREYDRWQELLAGLSFVMDMIDFTLRDINELLDRNHIGVNMDKYSEIEAMRKLVAEMTVTETDNPEEWRADMWNSESDRLWDYMKERCATYRRKVDRMEEKMNRNTESKR